jgi:hypothetical protein
MCSFVHEDHKSARYASSLRIFATPALDEAFDMSVVPSPSTRHRIVFNINPWSNT